MAVFGVRIAAQPWGRRAKEVVVDAPVRDLVREPRIRDVDQAEVAASHLVAAALGDPGSLYSLVGTLA